MKIKPFTASYPKQELITSTKSFFSNIKHQYVEYRDNGFYTESEVPCLYVYRIRTEDSEHTGLLSLTDIKEMKENNILKHEKTLASKEQNMMHLLLHRKAFVKPVLLGYHSNKVINDILEQVIETKPLLNLVVKADKEEHIVWKIDSSPIQDKLITCFKKIKKAYIGDGHHRSATVKMLSESKEIGKEAKKYDHLYTAFFSFDQLTICDYNRVVDISGIVSLPEFIIHLSKYFSITKLDEPTKPKKKHHVTFFIDGKWYKMKWKRRYIKKGKEQVILDSALINKYIFGKILGIKDVRVDTRIQYYGGTEPLIKISNSAAKSELGIGICIFPVSVDELTSIANNHETLPPKSTWFLPRLKSGIVAKNL